MQLVVTHSELLGFVRKWLALWEFSGKLELYTDLIFIQQLEVILIYYNTEDLIIVKRTKYHIAHVTFSSVYSQNWWRGHRWTMDDLSEV